MPLVTACFSEINDVAVVGGGNTALEDAMFLSNYCSKVYIIHRRDTFRGESHLADTLREKKMWSLCWTAWWSS